MSFSLIVVDDSDSSIQYSGSGWFSYSGSMSGVGNFGPTYQNTLHGTNSSGSLSLSFHGTTIEVWGTNNPVNTASGVNPTWECLLDNVSFNATVPFVYPENNWLFCAKQQLSDGPHTITVKANSNGPTFWFDYIRYTPSASVSTQNAVVSVDNHDPAIIYDSSWGPLGSTSTFTTTTGAQMSFNFTGTGLTWTAFIPTELSHNPTFATYSIDGGNPVTFPLNGLPSNSATVYNQIFFNVSGLSSGSHTLHVVHGGNSNTTPLSLVQLLITPSSPSSSPSSSNLSSAGGSPGSSGTSISTATNVSPSSPNSSQSNSTALPDVNSIHVVPSSTSRSSNPTGSPGSNVNANSGSHSTPIGAIVGGAVAASSLSLSFSFCYFSFAGDNANPKFSLSKMCRHSWWHLPNT